MKIVRFISAVLILVTVLVSLTGCDSGPAKPMNLIPTGSTVIGNVQLGAIMQGVEVYSQMSSDANFTQELDTVKQGFLDKTGISLNDISEVYLYGKTSASSSGDSESGAAILTGKFAGITPVNLLEKTGANYTSETDGKYTLYTLNSGDAAMAKISNSLLILGTVSAVKDGIAVANGDLDPATGNLTDTFNSLGDVMLKLVAVIPQEARQAFDTQNAAMMPVDLKPFSNAQMVSVVGGLAGSGLQMIAAVDFSSPDSAAAAVDSLKTLLSFFSMEGTAQGSDLLKNITITAHGSTLQVTHDIPLADFTSIISGIQNGEGFPLSPQLVPGMDGQNDFTVPSPFGGNGN